MDQGRVSIPKRPVILDLFCGAGGSALGLYRAGFDVVGVDKKPMPRYPFMFIKSDALKVNLDGFDAYWASPPCQRWSELTPIKYRKRYSDLITPIRERLKATSKPYIIENVEGARKLLINPIMLCGTMFGLFLYRHRWFETYPALPAPLLACNHSFNPVVVSGHSRLGASRGARIGDYTIHQKREAMQIDHMTHAEISQAIPPAFSEYLGKLLIKYTKGEVIHEQSH